MEKNQTGNALRLAECTRLAGNAQGSPAMLKARRQCSRLASNAQGSPAKLKARRQYSLLVTAGHVKARDLQIFAADEISVRAGLAGHAMVSVPADPDNGPLPESLSDGPCAGLDHLLRNTSTCALMSRAVIGLSVYSSTSK